MNEMKIIRSVLLASTIVLIGATFDLYVVTLADHWAMKKVGEIGELHGVIFLFLPKLVFGLLLGVGAEYLARKFRLKHISSMVLFGFALYFAWKFWVVEIWIAPDFMAYLLALGPYITFFLAFSAVALLAQVGSKKRKMLSTERTHHLS